MVKKIDIGYFIFQLLATSLATHGCSYSDTFHSLPWVIMEVIARDNSPSNFYINLTLICRLFYDVQ